MMIPFIPAGLPGYGPAEPEAQGGAVSETLEARPPTPGLVSVSQCVPGLVSVSQCVRIRF